MSAEEFWVNLAIHLVGIALCTVAIYWLTRLFSAVWP